MPFSVINGQDRPIEIIKEHISQSRLAHAYLFSGPEGVGKKLLAKTLAKAVNCLKLDNDSCDTCPSCLKVDKNQHPDVHFLDDGIVEDSLALVQVDAKSVKIEAIRNLQKEANLRPYEGKIKVFIIDNAHNLTPEAANALLKVLEEPPKHSLIILISSKTSVLFKTIVSRCQIIKFCPMQRGALSGILKKEYNLDDNFAHFLSFFCEGRLGLALKLKGTDIFSEKNKVIDEFCMAHNFESAGIPVQNRQDMRSILNVLAVWFRDIYMLKSGISFMEVVNIDRKDELLKASSNYSFDKLNQALFLISDSVTKIEQNINIKLLLANLKLAMQ